MTRTLHVEDEPGDGIVYVLEAKNGRIETYKQPAGLSVFLSDEGREPLPLDQLSDFLKNELAMVRASPRYMG